jgi:hypothetical protein
MCEKFNEFAVNKGFRELTKPEFNDRLKERYEVEKKNIDGSNWVWVYGLRYKTDDESNTVTGLQKPDAGNVEKKVSDIKQERLPELQPTLPRLPDISLSSTYRELSENLGNLGNLGKPDESQPRLPDFPFISPYRESTEKSGNLGKSAEQPENITELEHIKKAIRSFEETINDKRPLEVRDKQPFISWYLKQNGNTISASELWGIVEKEKAFTPETHPTPTPTVQAEQSRITVEVCGEVSEVVVIE